MKPTESTLPENNAFARFLSEHNDGDTLIEASEKLQDLIAKIRERLKPGEITLKIKFVPAAGASVVTPDVDISVKYPKEDKRTQVFFVTDEGQLTRKNPQQMEMKLRTVDAPTGPLKDLSQPTEETEEAAAQ